jgi:hypothetical protein
MKAQSTTAERLDALARRRVYFGHQSVGNNVLDGVRALLSEVSNASLRVIDAAEAGREPCVAHSKVGRNGDPLSKIADFVATVDRMDPDVAALKYCYVDVSRGADAKALFAHYQRAISDLRARHSQLRFVHITMPLTTIGGIKEWVGCTLRGRATSRELNAIRQQYNDVLRREYTGREMVFDIALVESTRADGSRVTFRRGGANVEALAEEFTDEGGHLNADGRRRAATAFIDAFASA